MSVVASLIQAAETAYKEFQTALEGVTERHAWAVLPEGGRDYLHTDASIQGVMLHVATCKVIYGSCGFRNTEIRWRDVAARLDTFEPSWSAALEYFAEAHEYWLSTWTGLSDADLDRDVLRFNGDLWPATKIVQTVTLHDAYHCGQVTMLRYAVRESDTPPPTVADDIRKYCQELPSW